MTGPIRSIALYIILNLISKKKMEDLWMIKYNTFSLILSVILILTFSTYGEGRGKGKGGSWKKMPGKATCGKDDVEGLKDPKTKKSFIDSTNEYGNPCKSGKVVDLKCTGGIMMFKCK
jgi:hypothetical protein